MVPRQHIITVHVYTCTTEYEFLTLWLYIEIAGKTTEKEPNCWSFQYIEKLGQWVAVGAKEAYYSNMATSLPNALQVCLWHTNLWR